MPMRIAVLAQRLGARLVEVADHRAAVAARLHEGRRLASDLAVVLLQRLVVVAVAGELEQLAQQMVMTVLLMARSMLGSPIDASRLAPLAK